MADFAHTETDNLIDVLEHKIKGEYAAAMHTIQAILAENEAAFKIEDAKKKATLSKTEYKRWRMAQIRQNEQLQDVLDEICAEYEKAHLGAQIAAVGAMGEAFALNTNYAVYTLSVQSMVDISFSIYDKNTVDILKKHPKLLPTTKGQQLGLYRQWNRKKVSQAVETTIRKGEDMRKLAKRLREVAGMEQGADIRNARTAVTAAENMGRQEGYKVASDAGLKVKKQWIATLDMRTRHDHRMADGQIVDFDKPFKVGGYDMLEPADPNSDAPASEIYNCRCCSAPAFAGYAKKATDLPLSPKLRGMTYDEWRKSKPVYRRKKAKK